MKLLKEYKHDFLIILILTAAAVISGYYTMNPIKQTIKRIDALEEKIDAYGIVFDWEGEKIK